MRLRLAYLISSHLISVIVGLVTFTAPMTANAVVLEGRLQFWHVGLNTYRPVRSTKVAVEVQWAPDYWVPPQPWLPVIINHEPLVVSTDSSGYFVADVGWPGGGPWRYHVDVGAETSAVNVRTQHSVPPPVLWDSYSVVVPTLRTVRTPQDVPAPMNYEWGGPGNPDTTEGRHFAVTYALQYAREFADAHRGGGDALPQVNVQLIASNEPFITFYDPGWGAIRWGQEYYWQDSTLIHEYAHFLQEQISGKFFAVPSTHGDCDARAGSGGYVINSAELAWMEGFADWFALAVYKHEVWDVTPNPTNKLTEPTGGTFEVKDAETFNCSNWVGEWAEPVPGWSQGGWIGPEDFEHTVAGTLWDLEDRRLSPDSRDGQWEDSEDNADLIFKIFDVELDTPDSFPTILDFHRAWVRRGMDPFRIEQIMEVALVDPLVLAEPVTAVALQHTQAATPNWWSGGVSVFARGVYQDLWPAVWGIHQRSTGAAFDPWDAYGSVAPKSAVSAVLTGPNIELLFRDSDHHVRRIDLTEASGQTESQLPDLTTGSNKIWGNPLFLKRADGVVEAYARRLDGAPYRSVQATAGGAFGAWTSLGGTATSGIAGAVSSNGRREIFVRGTDNRFWRCTNPGTGYCSWSAVNTATFTSAPAVTARLYGAQDTLVLCGRNTAGTLSCNQQLSPGVFGTWATVATDQVTSAITGAAYRDGAGLPGVSFFFRNASNATVRVDQPMPFGTWTRTDMGGTATSPPVVVRDSWGYRSLFVRGTNNDIWTREETAAGFGPWVGLG
ncbi:MAG: hypothetical protein HY904_10700, partial [Deltaproteobacteria bacterium]|nr:hypothetical protein [Deltaproteobacteria bacterium]